MTTLTKNERDELACVYSGLLLHDDKVAITADKIQKVLTASGNTTVESYYPEFFAKFMAGADLNAFMNNIGGGAATTAAVVAPVEAAAPAKDAKKGGDKKAAKAKEPEPVEEDEPEGGFGDLFG